MQNPTATYRLQFHKNFGFEQLQSIIQYLVDLGVATVYASPVFKSVPGSTHGYDGLDPNQLNPEIGTLEQLKRITKKLRSQGVGWLQDIVPNHMAFNPENRWLRDVLEKGQHSEYAGFFDIDWNEKLMVPFLGNDLETVIAANELKLVTIDGKKQLQYYDSEYPISEIDTEGKNAGNVRQLLEAQSYRLCSWQETDSRINYRRFFTINGLICMNMHDPDVFNAYHQLAGKLVKDGVFQGLRIDHIDGLYDPATYLRRLRERCGDEVYITVEKILQPQELLPSGWEAQGTTGYDFLALVNNLLTNAAASQSFTDFYQQLTGDDIPVEMQVQNKKAQILHHHMRGELDNLADLFRQRDLVNKKSFAAVRTDDLREAIAEWLIHCPVYRFYGNMLPLEQHEADAVQQVFNKIKTQNPELVRAVGLLEEAILHNPHQGNRERNEQAAHFYKRCMQFSGPLMAKGVEDTLMYTWNRFIAHNEVGDQPSSFGIEVHQFHAAMQERQRQWPFTMNATSTHDTKRGEDVRARLNVLTDLPEYWFAKVNEWREMNREITNAVDPNDEYFIYQSLTGAYPFPGETDDGFACRFKQYLEKAFREAKTHSNWVSPDNEYESAVNNFAGRLLDKHRPYWKSFTELQRKITDHGIINSLSQLVLKFTCPGIPDVYQGCETWDLSFVDPDNRRPVDFGLRAQWLSEIAAAEDDVDLFKNLWQERYTGKIKLWLTHQLFMLRKQQPELFSYGEYIPLEVEGTYRNSVIAFARKYRQSVYVIALPLHTAAICDEQGTEPLLISWKDTRIILPADVSPEWEDILLHSTERYKGEIRLKEAFALTPFMIWKGRQLVKERSAGILLHISSLPSPFGIGDLGPEARNFADFLYRAKQKYWQLLPLNPVEGGQGYSPYSAVSALAGNTLLISPELLVKDGLLDHKELSRYHLANETKVSFDAVEHSKEELINKAFWSYLKHHHRSEFEEFCLKESYWLEDYAMFCLLKKLNQGKPWYEWNQRQRDRDEQTLGGLSADYGDEIYRIKWLQYVFCRQWKQLKFYCNERNISLVGDLPIYVSYDSADVWANRSLFAIDEHGKATAVAGVPPDAFSEDGQLWGMPVFRWDILKQSDYNWWISRIRRNRELFDLIRIDHFRAFAAYWEVPAGETTARNGQWRPGPGRDFFTAVQDALGELPFIAEDLGDVDDTVFALRDEFSLPGMKVLQFAFGNDMPRSLHIPHNHSRNFLVYTGTHDNNTTLGWYRSADESTKRLLALYAGKPVTEDEVHWILARMAYGSVARIAILPMQDVLNLDESARMNVPASADSNWAWRLLPGQVNRSIEDKLKQLVELYNR